MANEMKTVKGKIIPVKINSINAMTIPIQIRRRFGLEPDDWLFVKEVPEKGAFIVYTQRAFKLQEVGDVTPLEKKELAKELANSGSSV